MSAAKKRGGRAPGAEGYNASDVTALLRCVREILPTGGNEWEEVLELYRVSHAVPNERARRDVNSIKTKFRNLTPQKKPTGNPTCPTEVREAFDIQATINEKCAYATINDSHHQAAVVPLSHSYGDGETYGEYDDELADEPTDGEEEHASESGVPKDTRRLATTLGTDEGERFLLEQVQEPQGTSAYNAQQTVDPARPVRKPSKSSAAAKRKRMEEESVATTIQRSLIEESEHRTKSASERFMQLQMQVAIQERDHERSERKTLAKKVDRLEQKIESLTDYKEKLRDRLQEALDKNRRLEDRVQYLQVQHHDRGAYQEYGHGYRQHQHDGNDSRSWAQRRHSSSTYAGSPRNVAGDRNDFRAPETTDAPSDEDRVSV